ncbi:MAG: DUF423 domain-containing protein [Bacteroidetes bacterium]|jgi:uncharacterized membrane protein YgdD (TMEM256/DUF423 family)|nr:DUF423 domain-containing protein [Bacteroidota bacterium]MBU1579663.1 DUF423 domain-containing protein [Bacteroidota bacterium]MBU2466867.1 DUF423 domain-containing protein [Bacteroidota bacterium]MBU2557800.1 DUF423 domain-containing protein [Bacteroidota bacterium]MDA3943628.1 DUF423 domain-containing protein [Bacteroidota bacterium]
MERTYVWTGSLFAGLAVILGALGAHWLRDNISLTDLQSFETGVRYQLFHALAILFLAALPDRFQGKLSRLTYYAFTFGTLFFSLSIYLLSTAELTGINLPWLGPITPIGGLLMIAGWLMLFISSVRSFK